MLKNFLFLLLYCSSFLYANEITTQQYYTYEKNTYISLDDIRDKQDIFQSFTLDTPISFGYDPKHNVLVRFIIKNHSNKKVDTLLVSKNPLVSQIIFYNQKGDELFTKGFLHKSKQKDIHATFPITLEAYEEKTYYLSFKSSITTLIVHLELFDHLSYEEWNFYNFLYLILFFGGMIALLIYNIFIYFATKDKAYLFYTLCIGATAFHHSAYTGFLFLFLDTNLTLLTFQYSFIVMSLPMYFLGLFSKYYLETKKFHKINQTINIFLIIIPLSWIFFTFFPEYMKFRNLISFIFLLNFRTLN